MVFPPRRALDSGRHVNHIRAQGAHGGGNILGAVIILPVMRHLRNRKDALVAGQDRPYVGLLAWPNLHACRQIVGNPDASYEEVIRHPEVLACLKRGLEAHNKSTEGASSMRVARAMLMVEPASIDGNELTDKGYINQRAGLERRAALVDRLYADHPGEEVIVLQ